jgi:fructokinase
VNPDRIAPHNLSIHVNSSLHQVVVLGEVLWDVFEHSRRLGGAPLNFGVHARRFGHPVTLISALGQDDLGEQASEIIAEMNLDTRLLQRTDHFPTGTAEVKTGPGGKTEFAIRRPAAYDALRLSERDLHILSAQQSGWFYFGTLFASTPEGKETLRQIHGALREPVAVYDLNLRPGADCPQLVDELLRLADVVKLNEEELRRVHEFTGLPLNVEDFCRAASDRYGWHAVAVTLGHRGCAVLVDGAYVEADGHPADVVDTVGAGDAFAAAFLHGLSLHWPVQEIACFANRMGALVASRPGAIPDLALDTTLKLG